MSQETNVSEIFTKNLFLALLNEDPKPDPPLQPPIKISETLLNVFQYLNLSILAVAAPLIVYVVAYKMRF